MAELVTDVKMAANGRLVLPRAVRRAIGIDGETRLIVTVEEGFPYAGIGTVNYQRTGQDENYTSYQFGLGLGFTPAPKVSLDVRAELQMAAKDQVSRKTGNFTVGASYALFSLN